MEVAEQVHEGVRLKKPKLIPEVFWNVVETCWALDPAHRPTFNGLQKIIQQIVLDMTVTDESEQIYVSQKDAYQNTLRSSGREYEERGL